MFDLKERHKSMRRNRYCFMCISGPTVALKVEVGGVIAVMRRPLLLLNTLLFSDQYGFWCNRNSLGRGVCPGAACTENEMMSSRAQLCRHKHGGVPGQSARAGPLAG